MGWHEAIQITERKVAPSFLMALVPHPLPSLTPTDFGSTYIGFASKPQGYSNIPHRVLRLNVVMQSHVAQPAAPLASWGMVFGDAALHISGLADRLKET